MKSLQGEKTLYLRPTTLDEALHVLAESRGMILSGGTDFFPALGDAPMTGPVVDISAVEEIRGIRNTPENIYIGGRTTWSDIVGAALPRGFAGLRAAAREVGSVQIQNFGTVAGNLCNASPAADGVTALLALDAQVTLASLSGTRSMALAEFITGNRKTLRKSDEILTSVVIPRRLENSASAFMKLGARRYLVISIAMVAANLLTNSEGQIVEALVAVGSCSTKSLRLHNLERALLGKSARSGIAQHIQQMHLAPLSPIDDLRGTAAYRSEAAQVLVARALEACVGQSA
jgi:CO/xanthine dehydrogenase FAD-binding subunit